MRYVRRRKSEEEREVMRYVRRRKSEEEREVMRDEGKGVMREKVKKGDDVRVGVTVSQ